MSDYISRSDAIEAVMKHKMPFTIQQEVAREIDELPSADADWIPCSERLPSEDGSYLVTSSFGKVYTAHFYSECGRWQYNRRGLIEAWQPLPKPYREGGEE